MERINRLIRAIDEGAPDGADQCQDDDAMDCMDWLTSSLSSTYLSFGIFDSLTLSKQRALKSETNDSDGGEGAMTQEEDAWRELESTSGNATKEDSSHHIVSTRRSGIRRGSQAVSRTGESSIPTKSYDGPSAGDYRSMLSSSATASDGSSPKKKQRSSPAA